MNSFREQQKNSHVVWRKTNISTQQKGRQNNGDYEYVIPHENWHENLWIEIRKDLPNYLKSSRIHAHSGTHNLLSSWIVCANLYFPLRINPALKNLMAEFLKLNVSSLITEISSIELEFAFPKDDNLHPEKLLGEKDGSRGSGQTSPDIAFKVKTKQGNGLVLCECKYTEHSFYPCSARSIKDNSARGNNPEPTRCTHSAKEYDYNKICHQNVWGRKYLSLVQLSKYAKDTLTKCPAATAGYQLLRQQALAEGIAKSERFELVASTVAFDSRNTTLVNCLKSTGIADFQTNWENLFVGKAIFKTWTHQDWVQFVRTHQNCGEFDGWLSYLHDRYGY